MTMLAERATRDTTKRTLAKFAATQHAALLLERIIRDIGELPIPRDKVLTDHECEEIDRLLTVVEAAQARLSRELEEALA